MLDPFFNAADAEARHYKRWEEAGCFKPSGDTSAQAYSIVIPPPNVTGVLHMGHALNNTLQDILIRFARMQGKNVLWQPGTDHAGIATQMVVERQLAESGGNQSRASMGREAFVDRVWQWKEESGGQIVGQLKRLGASCDWSRLAFTMGDQADPDNQMVEAVRKVFVDLFNEGLIYRDKRLVNWDPHFETAISDLEVEPKEVKGHYWHLKYPLADGVTYEHPVFDEEGEPAGTETRDYVVVATSRPETMLGDTGVAVHPDDERYKDLVGKEVILPIVGRRIPIVSDEYPDPEKGSGAVKITPAHDFNDFDVGRRCDLDVMNILSSKAAIVDGEDADIAAIPDAYRGLDRFEARKKVVSHFEEHDLMAEIESLKIEQPFGDRSGVVIEPWLTDQWYVNAGELAKDAIKSVQDGSTKFVPENWEKTYFNWMNDIQPWCVSRQLWWGHRIPVWYGPNGDVFCAMTEADALEQIKAKYPDAEISILSQKPTSDVELMEGNTVKIWQDEDVLDTWFSSALWPFSTMGWPNKTDELKTFYPGAVLVTAFDIIFFWVARMMMQGLHFMGEVPFKDVYIHALVLDEKGQKMSKSKGNVIDPLVMVDKYGADALRFFFARQAAQGRNIRLAEKGIEGYRNFTNKIWNASKFCQMNEAANLKAEIEPANLKHPVNQWIVGEAVRTSRAVAKGIESYRFNEAAEAIYRFTWNVFCDWYLELIKPLLNGEDDALIAETRAAAGWTLNEIIKMLHPFMPFLSEELWQSLPEDGREAGEFLMLQRWSAYGDEYENADADAEMAWVEGFISEVRSVRSTLNVPAGAKIDLTLVDTDNTARERMARHEIVIKRLTRLKTVAITDAAPTGSVKTLVEGASLCLNLEGLIDYAVEGKRLEKEIGKLEKEIGGLEKKLSNDSFLAKAPAEVVDEQRERLVTSGVTLEKLKDALSQLQAL